MQFYIFGKLKIYLINKPDDIRGSVKKIYVCFDRKKWKVPSGYASGSYAKTNSSLIIIEIVIFFNYIVYLKKMTILLAFVTYDREKFSLNTTREKLEISKMHTKNK